MEYLRSICHLFPFESIMGLRSHAPLLDTRAQTADQFRPNENKCTGRPGRRNTLRRSSAPTVCSALSAAPGPYAERRACSSVSFRAGKAEQKAKKCAR